MPSDATPLTQSQGNFWSLVACTHHNYVAWPVLNGAEEAEDDDDDVEEVG